jgi:hypothetical protein
LYDGVRPCTMALDVVAMEEDMLQRPACSCPEVRPPPHMGLKLDRLIAATSESFDMMVYGNKQTRGPSVNRHFGNTRLSSSS